jgi:hypothetical protein
MLTLIGYGLIHGQYQDISNINKKADDSRNTLQSMEDTIRNADNISARVADLTYTLSHAEGDLVSGDPAAWIYDTIRNFKGKYKVDISVNSQLSMGPVDLLAKFPYKQLKVTVSGTGYYHDVGKFIADFENAFPHARITNLILEPTGGAGDNSEKLAFRMDIIALANLTGPQGEN